MCKIYRNYQFKIMQYNSLLSAIPWKKRIKEHVKSPSKLEDKLFEKILQKEKELCNIYTAILLKRYILDYQRHNFRGQMYL